MLYNLLLISIASILTFSLLDRCKMYNINPKDCQNSVYIPDSSYDEYLRSFNIPIQKDPECDKKNCVIVVYKDPARIAVNTTRNPNNPGCHLQKASDCIPNIQNNPQENVKQKDNQTKEPQIVFHKLVNPEYEDKSERRKHSQVDSDEEDDKKEIKKKKKTVTETVTQSVPMSSSSEEKSTIRNSDFDKTSKKNSTEKDKEPDDCKDLKGNVPKTVTIYERDTTESPQTTTSHKPETVTIHERTTTESPQTTTSHKPETVTIYEQKATESPLNVVTVTVQPPVLTDRANTSKVTETPIGARRPEMQMICNKNDTDQSEFKEKFAELKTLLRDKICKQNPEKDGCVPPKKHDTDCDESSSESKRHHKKDKAKKKEDDTEESQKQPKKKKTESVITVTRVNTVTVTDEIPVTLYREIEKIITKDNTVTKFKVKTEYKTVSAEKETTTSSPVSPTVTIPIITPIEETSSAVGIPQTSSFQMKTVEPHVTVTPEALQDGDYNRFFKQYFDKFITDQKEITEKENGLRDPSLMSIPLVSPDLRDPLNKQEQKPSSVPAVLVDSREKDFVPEIITERNRPIGDELSKSLIPLFGQFLEKVTQESLSKVKKDEESITKPDIKTVFLTTTEFITETIRQPKETCSSIESQPCNKRENCKGKENGCVLKNTDAQKFPKKSKTIYNTVYKTAPMKMKCKPVIKNKVNCMIIKEGTVFKTIQDGKEEVENSESSPKKSSDEIKETSTDSSSEKSKKNNS